MISFNSLDKFDKAYPSMQVAMRDWISARMPKTGEALRKGVLMPSGYRMTDDEVAMHMATAAMAVLAQACSSAGLDGE